MCYNNTGILYYNTKNYEQAEKYLAYALNLRKELTIKNPAAYKSKLADSYNNVIVLYEKLGDFKKAKEYCALADDLKKRV